MFETIKEIEYDIFSIETEDQLHNAKYDEADALAYYEIFLPST